MTEVKQAKQVKKHNGYCESKVTTMGNITEIITMDKKSNGAPVKKIDKDRYIDLRTGEMCEYKKYENRSDGLDSIRVTLNRIRALINSNVTEVERVRWVTLTYAENMTDTKRLYSDYEKYWKRFSYWCEKQGHGKPEYITVQEPQGRGAWHVHAFFIWDGKAPYIPNDKMAELWKQGHTKTKAMQECDNVGAYFSAYLGDMPLDDVMELPEDEQEKALISRSVQQKTFKDEKGTEKRKKFVKGGRLYMYPPGMNIVRCSKGIKKPMVERMTYKKAKEKVTAATETFARTYQILDDNKKEVNLITKAYYNSKRK